MKRYLNNNKGITIITLVITIIVLLILAGISIASINGDNSIIKESIETKNMIIKEEIIENVRADILEKQKNNKYINLTEDEFKQILTKYGTLSAGAENINEEILTTKENCKIPVKDIYEVKIPISTEKSYIGRYADIDDDGQIDGIIFADLAVGSSGKHWNNIDGTYIIPGPEKGLKEYYVKETKKDLRWDEKNSKEVIIPKRGTVGKDRFYIMALEDIDSNFHTWYNDAYGNMIDFAECTSTEFGTGKNNTINMIKKYNANAYAKPTKGDLWEIIQGKLEETEDDIKWFVPSRAEWSAFAAELGISDASTDNNHVYHKLENLYWSSSRYIIAELGMLIFHNGCMYDGNVNYAEYVRLATTF